ncbi:MAG: hypothetical protein A2418_00225 [Candidatus Brennerbacteria bacterium RIFOXYC1_FULL_41_11]|uniref:Uncharacterized protein n=1 Tax=Candidatus Brennerbacteria bacterium RIFOXYD1_FULL_41_16 TaxID=1797529 RepID=A0A1G1XKU2_9BACT|nr:MAG: hypothetical protein A2391_01685 [Candidatus Brennerbacteria bacterium RIFOXYB1_FULL_41_13]OGY39662.1 MAG: hypothetical protein A2418_00225 [Candidatus Brennerbacteria bacterium RIFOXYC1_FULL_41_11]OGY40286.1 MAG: hypothetical protein A2570_03350 [Candidatus Brennerbacteria bacterium RIFOXYD1_FULL_41_16]
MDHAGKKKFKIRAHNAKFAAAHPKLGGDYSMTIWAKTEEEAQEECKAYWSASEGYTNHRADEESGEEGAG